MAGAIAELLSADHARLDALLAQSTATEVLDLAAYKEFRAGLLRHIAMEEKVLFAEARRRGEPLPIFKRLHADHAALASLLVPRPTHALLAIVRAVLDEHNPLEEGTAGFYASCEPRAPSEAQELVARMRALPPLRIAQHVDEPRIHDHIARMLEARRNV